MGFFETMPRMNSFLRCMGLQMGTKFIAFLHLTASLIVMVICAYLTESFRANIGTVVDEDQLYTQWYRITLAITLLSSVHLLLGLLLFVGAHKQNQLLLRVWLCIMGVLFVGSILFLIVNTAMFGIRFNGGSDLILSIVQAVVFYGVLFYCLCCVNSYYLMLKSSQDMEGPKDAY